MREHNRDRLRRILDEIGRQGWEMVIITQNVCHCLFLTEFTMLINLG